MEARTSETSVSFRSGPSFSAGYHDSFHIKIFLGCSGTIQPFEVETRLRDDDDDDHHDHVDG
jgi:hypothetical protein